MALIRAHVFGAFKIFAIVLLMGCQAQPSTPKQSSTQDLLAQVEAIEADESSLLFQQAQAAAQKDNVNEAKSLVKQALGRGAGSVGKVDAETEIKRAEARIAERKRKAEEARLAKIRAEEEERQRRSRAQENERLTAEQKRRNDGFCYSIDDDNARYACLNKPYATRNEDSRNILLGLCYSLSRSAENQGYDQVCAIGKNGCYSLKNDNLHNPCTSCDGSKKWAAVAAAGVVMTCY